MLPTQVHSTKARVTPSLQEQRRRSTSYQRDTSQPQQQQHAMLNQQRSSGSQIQLQQLQHQQLKPIIYSSASTPHLKLMEQFSTKQYQQQPPSRQHNFRRQQERAQSSPNSNAARRKSSTSVAAKENQLDRSAQHKKPQRQNSNSQKKLSRKHGSQNHHAVKPSIQVQDNADIEAFLYGGANGVQAEPGFLSMTIDSVPTARGTLPQSLELAIIIFEKAAKKYGAKLIHNKVDSVIRRSQFANQVDKVTRKYLKSLIISFERNGNDAAQAIQLEQVKQKCSELARDHYRRSLLQKGLFMLIHTVIERRGKDPQAYVKSTTSNIPHSMTNTTLNRMLEGVIASSKTSQLEEFIEIEKTLETTLSEALTSEPCIDSARIPPKPKLQKPEQRQQNPLQLNSNFQLKSLTYDDGSKLHSGVQSPSVTELEGDFQAFNEDEDGGKSDFALEKLSSSPIQVEQLPTDGVLSATNKETTSVPFFLGPKNATFGQRGLPEATHLKIAQLFKTTVQSSIDTQVDEQIKRLDHELQPGDIDEDEEDSATDPKKIMASYVRKQFLLGKAFAAFVKPKDQKNEAAEENTHKQVDQTMTKQQKSARSNSRTKQTNKYDAYRSSIGTVPQNATKRAGSRSNSRKQAKSKRHQTAELEKPVRPEKSDNVLQSCTTSPNNRLQRILTDNSRPVAHHFLSQQPIRQNRSRSRQPSPLEDTQQWQSQDSRHMLFLEQSGVRLHVKSLKRQIFKSLEFNVTLTRMNEQKADQFFKHRALKALRQYMYGKRRERDIQVLFEQSRQERLVAFSFRNWRGRIYEIQVASQFRRDTLLKNAFDSLLKGTLHVQQHRQIGSACRKHFQGSLLRNILKNWNQIAADNFEPRKRYLQIQAHMQHYRMSRMIKEWFNQIDLLKHELALQRDVLQSRTYRLKTQFFQIWFEKYQKQSKRRDRLDKLAKFREENFARRYFSPWLKLANRIQTQRQKFFTTRARNLNRKAFYALKLNLYNSSGEMQRARKIIMMRAERLIKTVFYRGLVEYGRTREISRENQILADKHRQAYLIIESFKAIQKHTQRLRKAKVLATKHTFMNGKNLFYEWQSLSKNVLKAKKLRSKVLIERQFQSLKALYENAKRSKMYKQIISHCLQRYSLRLLQTSMNHLSENIERCKAKQEIYGQIEAYRARHLETRVFQALRQNKLMRRQRRKMLNNFQIRQEDTKLELAFRKLRAFRIDQQFKKSYLPILATRQMEMKERCLEALRKWKTNRVIIKSMLSAHLNYRQECMLENAFEGLMIHTQYAKESRELRERADEFRANQLFSKSFETLVLHKVCKKNQKALIHDVEKVRRRVRFINWFNLVHDDLPNERKADEFFLRFRFNSIRNLAVGNRAIRAKKNLLGQLSREYYPYMLKKRGVIKWRTVKDRSSFVSTTQAKIRENKMRKMFNGWWNNVDRLSEGKSRQIMWTELNKRFQFRRVLTALSTYTEEKKHEKHIIKVFQTKHGMIDKARIFSALISMNCQDRVNGRQFIEKMHSYGQKLLLNALTTWRDQLVPARNHDMADLFYERRAAKFLLRKCFDRLRVGACNQHKKDIKHSWLQKVCGNQLLRRCFTDLTIYTKRKVKERHAFAIVNKRNATRTKTLVWDALTQNCSEGQRLEEIQTSINKAFNKIRLRKVMIALQEYTAKQMKSKIVSAKWALRIKDQFLARWQEQSYKARKVHRMVTILNEQNALKFIRAFMLKLEDVGTFMVFKRTLDSKLQAKAMQALKQQWLLSRMQDSLIKRHDADLCRKVFTALKFNQFDRISLRDNIMQQADLQIDEDKYDVMRVCFEQLKLIRYKAKANRVARGTFGLNVIRRAFTSMRSFTLKRKMLQVNYNEILILRKQRFLHKMLAAYDKNQREREAGAIINFDRVHTVMQAWKKYTHEEKLIKQFRQQTYIKNLKQTAISGLQKNVIIENFQRIMYLRIKKRQNVDLKRDAFTALRNGIKLRAIQNNMKVYHLHKFSKRVMKSWRARVEYKNRQRLNLIKQRAALEERPYLSKPLLAMRNLLMFRAFRSIMLNANTKKEFKFNRQICTYSIYLRLQRKAFYGLRLNAAARFQRKKSKEIKKLMIARRWFTYLKRVTQMQKIKRKQQTDAAIFRFLSLQRRGLLQWVSFISKMKRVKIKRHFSLTLYYNRMCDKVFTALKVNAAVKARKRKETDQASGYITTSSSEIMHEASFTHRTKLNMSSLQQFVNSSNPTLQFDPAQLGGALNHNINSHVNSDIILPSGDQYLSNNAPGLSNAQNNMMGMSSEPPINLNEQQMQQQYYTGQGDSGRFQQYNSYGSNNDGNGEEFSSSDRQEQMLLNPHQLYNNFYSQPLDRINNARNQDQFHPGSHHQLPHPLYNELSQLSNLEQNQMLLIQTSLPTPQNQEGLNGNRILNHQDDNMNQKMDPYAQQQPFNGDLSQPQQLTLGTMPDLLLGSHDNNRMVSDSYRTQNWIASPEQSPLSGATHPLQQQLNIAFRCQLCEDGIRHEHNADLASQMTKFQPPNSVSVNTRIESQAEKNMMAEYAIGGDDPMHGSRSDNAQQQSSNMQELQSNRSPSPVLHNASANYNTTKDGQMQQLVPERDFNSGPTERFNQDMLEISDMRDQKQEGQESDAADFISNEMLGELISNNCYDDHIPGPENIKRHIQVNMDNMNVIHSNSMMTSQRSTPDLIYMRTPNQTRDPSRKLHPPASSQPISQPLSNEKVQMQKQQQHMQQPSYGAEYPTTSQVFSHQSQLKTTPGHVRQNSKAKMAKKMLQLQQPQQQ